MKGTRSLILTVFLLSCTAFRSQADEVCDKSQCQGPIRYYEDLQCKPVYRTPESCCPYKYNCDHLKERSPNKCYIGNHEYDVDAPLREEDAEPCDKGCFCKQFGEKATFVCAIVDCFSGKVDLVASSNRTYYSRRKATDCCPQYVSVENDEERPKCLVDGKEYQDGEMFTPKAEPDKTCYCGPEYKGENIEPFCRRKSRCNTELRHPYDDKCVPAYYATQSPQTNCSIATRCQNDKDSVIEKFRALDNPDVTDDMVCRFGDLTMKYGDELVQATHYDSVCMKCTCEVGPFPTCQRLPDDECDITKHPKFDNF